MALQTDVSMLDPVKFTDNLSDFIRLYEPREALDKPKEGEEAAGTTGYDAMVKIFSLQKFSQMPLPFHSRASSVAEVKLDYIKGQPTCLSRLRQIRELLLLEEPPSPFLVQQTLGHGVMAGK